MSVIFHLHFVHSNIKVPFKNHHNKIKNIFSELLVNLKRCKMQGCNCNKFISIMNVLTVFVKYAV